MDMRSKLNTPKLNLTRSSAFLNSHSSITLFDLRSQYHGTDVVHDYTKQEADLSGTITASEGRPTGKSAPVKPVESTFNNGLEALSKTQYISGITAKISKKLQQIHVFVDFKAEVQEVAEKALISAYTDIVQDAGNRYGPDLSIGEYAVAHGARECLKRRWGVAKAIGILDLLDIHQQLVAESLVVPRRCGELFLKACQIHLRNTKSSFDAVQVYRNMDAVFKLRQTFPATSRINDTLEVFTKPFINRLQQKLKEGQISSGSHDPVYNSLKEMWQADKAKPNGSIGADQANLLLLVIIRDMRQYLDTVGDVEDLATIAEEVRKADYYPATVEAVEAVERSTSDLPASHYASAGGAWTLYV